MTELRPTGKPVIDKSLQDESIYANIAELSGKEDEKNQPPTGCEIHVDQTGVLKCMVAILAVICIALGASLVIVYVYRQQSTVSQFEELNNEVRYIMRKLNDTNEEMDDRLRRFNDEQLRQKVELEKLKLEPGTKVAFSASLLPTGEQNADIDPFLAYKHVFTNAGNAYNPDTGHFVAPVKGIYFFCFNTFGYGGATSGAILTKNGHLMVSTYEFVSSHDASDMTGNAVVLQLEPGERVSMQLWQHGRVFGVNGHNTFSGFLLFPL